MADQVGPALHPDLAAIMPDTVHAVGTSASGLSGLVRPDERDLVGVGTRRHQSIKARECGRVALTQLGFRPLAIPRSPSGLPCWPVGVVGSLTHTDGYIAAAVALRRQHASIGIDAEPNEPVGASILAYTCPGEPEAASQLARQEPTIAWDRLLFSAKEAAFKAFFAMSGRTVPMTAARATLHRDGTFLVSTEPAHRFRGERWDWPGRWCLSDGFLLTAVVLP